MLHSKKEETPLNSKSCCKRRIRIHDIVIWGRAREYSGTSPKYATTELPKQKEMGI